MLRRPVLPQGFVYWSEEVTRSICRASKHNGGNLQVLLSNITSPGGVLVIQPVLQPKGIWVKRNERRTCSFKLSLCLLTFLELERSISLWAISLNWSFWSWFLGPPSKCGLTATVCAHGCAVDSPTECLKFSCTHSDATFAGILSLISKNCEKKKKKRHFPVTHGEYTQVRSTDVAFTLSGSFRGQE